MYLYRTTIYKTPDIVAGLSSEEKSAHAAAKTDFEGNHKASAVKVDEIITVGTTYVIDKDYSDFDAMITGAIAWTDVKYIENSFDYKIYLSSETEL